MHLRTLRPWFTLSILLLCATACAYAIDAYVSFTSQAMIYVLVVAIAAYRLDRTQSILCALLSVLLLNFFFVPPRWTLHIDQSEHLIALLTLVIVALVINHLSTHLKNETASAQLNERRAQRLQNLAINLMAANTPTDILSAGKQAFSLAFPTPCVLAILDQNETLSGYDGLSEQQVNGLRCCIKELSPLGAGSGRWGNLDDWYLPIGQPSAIYGAVCITQAPHDDDASLAHARALCALLAQAYSRMQMNTAMLEARHTAQKQQLQSTFLAAISHDLRTPLAVMTAAASALQAQSSKLSAQEHDSLLQHILVEANYLTTIAENTLQLVRLENAPESIRRDWESMEEIVGAVLSRIRQRTAQRSIKVQVAPALPLLKLDSVLIAQLLSNLLDNALKYSEGEIAIIVQCITEAKETKEAKEMHPQSIEVLIKDRGPGIPEAEHDSIFQAYSRLAKHDQINQRSAGLGLAVCRAIALAHQAQLSVRDRRSGGSCFVLRFALCEDVPAHFSNP